MSSDFAHDSENIPSKMDLHDEAILAVVWCLVSICLLVVMMLEEDAIPLSCCGVLCVCVCECVRVVLFVN